MARGLLDQPDDNPLNLLNSQSINGLFDPAIRTPPPQNLLAPQPTWADAWQFNAQEAQAELARQREISRQRGLWDSSTGLPTQKGLLDVARQYANALVMGTTAPQFRGPHFELDPYELKPADNLTPDQQNAVNHYSNLSTYINEGEGPEVEALRGHLDAAIERSRLSDDARLYRGFSVPTEHIEQIKPGDVVQLGPGYVSTTLSKDVARNFSNDETGGPASVFVQMRVPRGHPALHVPTSPEIENEFGIQHEVLLPRNTQFHVHSVNEKSDGRYEVLAEPVTHP